MRESVPVYIPACQRRERDQNESMHSTDWISLHWSDLERVNKSKENDALVSPIPRKATSGGPAGIKEFS